MPTFSAKNFPATENNLRFSGAGERTDYITCQPGEGFPVDTDTTLFPHLSSVDAGTRVWFTSPELNDSQDAKGIFGSVSFSGPDQPEDGYIRISHIQKPSGKNQNRVAMGAAAQESVKQYVFDAAGNLCLSAAYVDGAPPGSNRPDLIMNVDSLLVQFEIKGAPSLSSTITLFDKSVRRGQETLLDRFCGPLGYDTLEDCINASDDPSVGFAGDPGVVKSGKMPTELFNVRDEALLYNFRRSIIDHFAESGDSYFAVYDRGAGETACYFTGHGRNALSCAELPELASFSLSTYGGPSSGATRVGVKVKFDF